MEHPGHLEPPARQPLAGVRVLECGDTLAAAYAGRLLSDLRADVIKVEGLAGPLRALGPFVGGVLNRDQSASFGYFHAGQAIGGGPAVEGVVA